MRAAGLEQEEVQCGHPSSVLFDTAKIVKDHIMLTFVSFHSEKPLHVVVHVVVHVVCPSTSSYIAVINMRSRLGMRTLENRNDPRPALFN
jgi:hypothetical protein